MNPTSRDCLLVADETALPAACSIIAGLDETFRVQAFLEVCDPDDLRGVPSAADLTCHWFIRGDTDAAPGALAAAGLLDRLGVGDAELPSVSRPGVIWETERFSAAGEQLLDEPCESARTDYFWVAGEAGMVAGLRRVLTGRLGVARQNAAFMGYWRQGRSST